MILYTKVRLFAKRSEQKYRQGMSFIIFDDYTKREINDSFTIPILAFDIFFASFN